MAGLIFFAARFGSKPRILPCVPCIPWFSISEFGLKGGRRLQPRCQAIPAGKPVAASVC